MEMNLIGAEVHTQTGRVGRVKLVAMDPNSHKLTHLIVHVGKVFGRNVVVPVEQVEQMSPGKVMLSVCTDDLRGFPEYEERHFIPPDAGWEYPIAFPMSGVVWPYTPGWADPAQAMADASAKQSIPSEDIEIESGTPVECTDGHCGHVERVVVDEQTHEVTGFTIRRGLLFARDVEAPLSWIDHLEKDHVFLKLTRKQVGEMMEYFEK